MILLAIVLAPLAEAETRVSGEISTSTTWTLAGSPYLVDGPVYVRGSGAPVLTIEPGVVVKVGNGHLISAGEGGTGSLRAIGTAEKPIVFTTLGAVVPDWWRGLYLMAGAGGSRLENVVVEGGGWGYNAGITVTGSAPVLKNVTVRTSSQRGIRVDAGGAPEITDSTVTGTTGGVGAGIEISAGARAKLLRVAIRQCATHGLLVGAVGEAELTDVEISGNGGGAIAVQPGAQLAGLTGMVLTGNGQNGVRHLGGNVTAGETWKSFGYPYYVVDSPVYVRGSGAPVLTIEPGVVVKVGNGHLISAGDGGTGILRVIGTEAKPIVFTTLGAVAPDWWRGLYLTAGSGGSRLENVIVEGGGWGYTSGITVTGSAPVLKNVTVRTSSQRGIRVDAGGAPEITDSTVTGTTGGVGAGIEISAGARAKLLRVAIRQCATHGLLVGAVGEAELTDVEISGNGGGAIAVQPGAQLAGLTGMVLTGNGQNGVRHLGGNVTAGETWKSFGYPYYVVDGPVYVRGSGAPVLTIEPGVEVKVGNGHLISAGDGGTGILRVIGTEAKPIVFTTLGAVVPDWWRGLYLMAGSGGSRLENVVVEGGGWGYNAGITVTGSAPVLKNVTVRTSSQRGIRVEAGGAPDITDSTVTGTTGGVGAGIEIGAGARAKLLRVAIRQCSTHGLLVGTVGEAELTDVEISGNGGGAIAVQPGAQLAGLTGMTLTGNGQNGVRHLGGNVAAGETWKSFGHPYYVVDGPVYVRGSGAPVLTIEPGVVVKVGNGHLISAGDGGTGSLRAIGTGAKPIVFTTLGAVVPDWWRGLYLMAGSGGSRLENVIVEGGGWGYNAGITVTGSAPVLKNVTVRTSSQRGIRVEAGGAPDITDSTVTGTTGGEGVGIRLSNGSAARIERTTASGNSGAGIVNEGSHSWLRFVTLAGNGSDGLRSASGELSLRDGALTGQPVPVRNSDSQSRVVDARQQWWGSVDGPSGLVGRVECDPWLGGPPTPAFAVTSLESSTRAFPSGTSSVRLGLELPSIAAWVLRFLAPDGSEAKRFEGTGRSATVTWDGTGTGGAALADGEYRVRLEATEESTGRVAAPLVGRISLDGSLPVGTLTAPAGFVRARVGDELTVLGSAGGTGFQSYVLEAGAGDFPASWTVVDRGVLPVATGTLGSFTTALLPPGRFTLRLSVTGAGGKAAFATARIELFEEGECR